MRNPLLLCAFVFLTCACEKVTLRDKAPALGEPTPAQKTERVERRYRMDGPGGLFKNVKWYHYDMASHIIWPFHDVYALKTARGTHLIQIRSFYADEALSPGFVLIASRTGDGPVTEHRLDGRGCGNPFTNPDFAGCTRDPERFLFAALDLDEGRVRLMSERALSEDADWDLALRSTELRLNAGPGAKAAVQGALVRRFDFFFDAAGAPLIAELRKSELRQQAFVEFNDLSVRKTYDFHPPDGIDRVLHESYWYKENTEGLREALTDSAWIVRGRGGHFAKLSFAGIDEALRPDGGIDTRIRLRYLLQTSGEEAFTSESRELPLEISTDKRLRNLCARLAEGLALECSEAGENWDLKLTVIHRVKDGVRTREWLLFTSSGAIGPLSAEEAGEWRSGSL